MLTKLWREADAGETLRAHRKTQGVAEDDLEDPLPEGVLQGLPAGFAAYYHFSMGLSETLCEPLLGRLKRETDRSTHTVVSMERVRSAREAARTSAGKRLR